MIVLRGRTKDCCILSSCIGPEILSHNNKSIHTYILTINKKAHLQKRVAVPRIPIYSFKEKEIYRHLLLKNQILNILCLE